MKTACSVNITIFDKYQDYELLTVTHLLPELDNKTFNTKIDELVESFKEHMINSVMDEDYFDIMDWLNPNDFEDVFILPADIQKESLTVIETNVFKLTIKTNTIIADPSLVMCVNNGQWVSPYGIIGEYITNENHNMVMVSVDNFVNLDEQNPTSDDNDTPF